eukprot:5360415-Prymnesium_polylepis.1
MHSARVGSDSKQVGIVAAHRRARRPVRLPAPVERARAQPDVDAAVRPAHAVRELVGHGRAARLANGACDARLASDVRFGRVGARQRRAAGHLEAREERILPKQRALLAKGRRVDAAVARVVRQAAPADRIGGDAHLRDPEGERCGRHGSPWWRPRSLEASWP